MRRNLLNTIFKYMNNYTKGTMPGNTQEPECHWGWQAAGTVIGLVCLSWLGVYIADCGMNGLNVLLSLIGVWIVAAVIFTLWAMK